MDAAVDLAAAFVIGRDNQRALRVSNILTGDFSDAFLPVADLMHPAL
jgi:hypothetical protein